MAEDPIIGKLPDGRIVYKDEKGEMYALSNIHPPKPKADTKANIPDTKKNILDTKTSTGTSGTPGTVPIADYTVSAKVIVDDSKVDSDIVKIINENKVTDPIEWYTKRILRRV